MDHPKYSLHLFAGAGGGLLADIIDGIRPVCAVEIERYPQRILAKRFPDLAVWDDVCTFRADNPECADAFADLRAVADELVIAGGFLARISAAQGAARDYAESAAAYGESMRVSLAKYDPPTCSWKIHPCLFSGDLATFSETWPRFGMMRRGVSYRLRTWEPCTCASGSGSQPDEWPTPTVHGNDNYKGASAKSGDGLMTVIKRREGWPTPTAKDANGPWHTTHSPSLNVVCTQWPTPCATDYKGPGKTPRDRLDYAVNSETKSAVYPTPCASARPCEGSVRLLRKAVERGTLACAEANAMNGRNIWLKQGRLSRFDTPTVHGDGGSGRNGAMPKYGQLNPDWVEWLMFWPVGWTDIETPNIRLVWLDPSIDPADLGEIPRVTNRRDNRPARIKALGNGQFPLSAAVAFHWGLCVLEAR